MDSHELNAAIVTIFRTLQDLDDGSLTPSQKSLFDKIEPAIRDYMRISDREIYGKVCSIQALKDLLLEKNKD